MRSFSESSIDLRSRVTILGSISAGPRLERTQGQKWCTAQKCTRPGAGGYDGGQAGHALRAFFLRLCVVVACWRAARIVGRHGQWPDRARISQDTGIAARGDPPPSSVNSDSAKSAVVACTCSAFRNSDSQSRKLRSRSLARAGSAGLGCAPKQSCHAHFISSSQATATPP